MVAVESTDQRIPIIISKILTVDKLPRENGDDVYDSKENFCQVERVRSNAESPSKSNDSISVNESHREPPDGQMAGA